MERLIIGQTVLELVRGDITEQGTEAIVNSANNQLSPGGGVSGAIHRAAGLGLWEECKKLGDCKTGEAKLTFGHRLKAKYVIHTVGPVYSGSPRDREDLRACYLNSLRLADAKGIVSVSFPAISAGIFGYPLREAAEVSLLAVKDYLKGGTRIRLVRFVLYEQQAYAAYLEALKLIRVRD